MYVCAIQCHDSQYVNNKHSNKAHEDTTTKHSHKAHDATEFELESLVVFGLDIVLTMLSIQNLALPKR